MGVLAVMAGSRTNVGREVACSVMSRSAKAESKIETSDMI